MIKHASAPPVGPAPGPEAWLRWVGHCGFVAEGIIYLLIGALALLSALEPGRRPKGSGGALASLAHAPLGNTMLVVLTLGLAAYVLWQLVQAALDPEHRRERWTMRRVGARLGCVLNAALYCVLVGEAGWRLAGLGGAGGNGHAQVQLIARAMRVPLGREGIGAIGAGVALYGLIQFYAAATRNRGADVDLTHAKLRGGIIVLGMLGLLARGILFILIGAILIDAAWRYNLAHTRGIAGAFIALKRHAYGPWLLGALAAGLMAYGIYQIAKEPYREFGAN